MSQRKTSATFDSDAILRGISFASVRPVRGTRVLVFYRSVLESLKAARKHAGRIGIIPTMPELIAARVRSGVRCRDFRSQLNYSDVTGFDTGSEEFVGYDRLGIHYDKNKLVLLVLHGCQVITPERIEKTVGDYESVDYVVFDYEKEFTPMLKGQLPTKKEIPIYTIERFINEQPPITRSFGVVVPFDDSDPKRPAYAPTMWFPKLSVEEFVVNHQVIARAGNTLHLRELYELMLDDIPHSTLESDLTGGWKKEFLEECVPGSFLRLTDRKGIGTVNLSSERIGNFIAVSPIDRRNRKTDPYHNFRAITRIREDFDDNSIKLIPI